MRLLSTTLVCRFLVLAIVRDHLLDGSTPATAASTPPGENYNEVEHTLESRLRKPYPRDGKDDIRSQISMLRKTNSPNFREKIDIDQEQAPQGDILLQKDGFVTEDTNPTDIDISPAPPLTSFYEVVDDISEFFLEASLSNDTIIATRRERNQDDSFTRAFSLGDSLQGLPFDPNKRDLRSKKKTAYLPDGNLLPAKANGKKKGLKHKGIGTTRSPASKPGITAGVTRTRDSINARNYKVKHGGHALCTNLRFTPPLSFPSEGAGPTDMEVGDVNGDKIKDLVVAASGSDVVVVFLGRGDGTFFHGTRFPVGPPGSYPYRIRLADVNRDGRLDIVTANLGGQALSVLLGRGDGSFTNGFVFPTGGGGPVDLALGDFNGDGILDIALALAARESLTVLWGDGLGSFVRPLQVALGGVPGVGFPLSILAVDLNLDGFADVVVGLSTGSRSMAVLTSLGDGTFRRPALYDLGTRIRPVALVVGLFNTDLFPDVATVNGGLDNSVSILLGRGDGTFHRPRSYSISPGLAPMALAVGDFNGDLHADIVTANALSNDVTLLRGEAKKLE